MLKRTENTNCDSAATKHDVHSVSKCVEECEKNGICDLGKPVRIPNIKPNPRHRTNLQTKSQIVIPQNHKLDRLTKLCKLKSPFPVKDYIIYIGVYPREPRAPQGDIVPGARCPNGSVAYDGVA